MKRRMHPHQRRVGRGSFTLIETAVVLTIVVVLIMISVPRMMNMLTGSALQVATRKVYSALLEARSNAITSRQPTRVYFPVATESLDSAGTATLPFRTRMQHKEATTANANNFTDAELAQYHNSSFIIASYRYDDSTYPSCPAGELGCVVSAARGWRWIALTPWQFLPKGAVFDHNTKAIASTDTTLFTPSGSFLLSTCVQLRGGQTAFNNSTPTVAMSATAFAENFVFYSRGANETTFGQCVLFSDAYNLTAGNALTGAAYIQFTPTGGCSTCSATSPVTALKIVEGFRAQDASVTTAVVLGGTEKMTVSYTHEIVNASPAACTATAPCPNSYTVIAIDKLTGRAKVYKPGGTDGGCPYAP